MKLGRQNTQVLYYDCTNYFFESEEEGGLKQYGCSKENRPNPILQMGMFMDMEEYLWLSASIRETPMNK